MTATDLRLTGAINSKAIAKEHVLTRAEQEGYVSIGRSAIRHWILVVTAVVIGLLFGAGGGAVVSPTYTARAQLIIGKSLNLTNTAAISGFPSAEAQLASDYARLANSPAFYADLVSHLKGPLKGSASATPVAASPVIAVYGTAHNQAEAVAIANAASAALIDSINTVNQQTTSANQGLLNQYQADALTMERDQQNVADLQAQLPSATGAARDSLITAIASASATVDTDKFKLSVVESQYQAQFNPDLSIEQAVTALGGAASQGGNRATHLEIGTIAGVVAGLVLGMAIAASLDVVADRRARRYYNFPTVD